jgi:outer membrane lipoprotein-sorting protein
MPSPTKKPEHDRVNLNRSGSKPFAKRGARDQMAEMFSRRRLLMTTLPLLTAPALARAVTPITQTPQDQADIDRVEVYLNWLKSLKAHFLQVASNGGLSEGTAWMERPGRMRFQYNPPSPFLLLASSGVLTFHDASLGQTSNISLSRTPLGILLAEHVSLSGAATVTGIQRQPGQLQITIVRTQNPGDGSLTLILADQPLTLRQWIVVDAQRRETRVTFDNILIGGTYDPRLFDQVSLPAGVSGNPL